MKNLSDSDLEKVIQDKFWKSLAEMVLLSSEDDNDKFLNEYRWALSLWAEYTNDTKNKVIVTLDGRDTAWKWSNIKRVTEYFDIKRYDVNAYWIPSSEERINYNWFNRYMNDFPDEGKVSFFDRSWYNRAWVEAAMWFCSKEEYVWFMKNVNQFEKDQIVDMWIDFVKVYLSITKNTQKERLQWRESARKRWKSSIIDAKAQEKWNSYTRAKYKMLELTDSEHSPWLVIDSNKKFLSASEIIKAIIRTSDEVSKMVKKDLSIDLSVNKKVARTASEELKRMKQTDDFEKMKSEFQFREEEKVKA